MPAKKKQVLPYYEPPEWATEEMLAKYKDEIEFVKKHSDVVQQLHFETKGLNAKLRKTDIDKLVYKTIVMKFGKNKNRFASPSSLMTFNSKVEEVAANILFKTKGKYKGYVEYKKLRRKFERVIPQECSIDMLNQNPVFDWSFMGIREAKKMNAYRLFKGRSQMEDKEYAEYAFSSVEKFVESRNKTEAYAREIEIKNKGKFIHVDDITYEFLMHKTNYFDIMYLFLVNAHKEEDYVEYASHILTMHEQLDIPRKEEFSQVQSQLKPNDDWQIFDNDQELYLLVRLFFFSF